MWRQKSINFSLEIPSGYSNSHGDGGMWDKFFPIIWVILFVGVISRIFGSVPSIQMDVNFWKSPKSLNINKLYKNEGPTKLRTILFIKCH